MIPEKEEMSLTTLTLPQQHTSSTAAAMVLPTLICVSCICLVVPTCAHQVLGLARMVMAAGIPVRLRVLLAVVENNIAGGAFRPGDVLTARNGESHHCIHKMRHFGRLCAWCISHALPLCSQLLSSMTIAITLSAKKIGLAGLQA